MTLASGLDAGASAGAHALARYRSEFPIFRHAVYLNTCSLGALGDRTRRRIAEFFDLWQARGASAWYDVWWAALSELRARYARVVGASPEDRKSTRLNSSHRCISYAVFCLKKKNN